MVPVLAGQESGVVRDPAGYVADVQDEDLLAASDIVVLESEVQLELADEGILEHSDWGEWDVAAGGERGVKGS
jgi:hypothetical protein